MRAGELRHRVTVQYPVEGEKDYVGDASLTWTATASNVACNVTPLSGNELLAARQANAQTTYTVRMRYGTTVTPQHRLLFGTQKLEIESVLNVGERNRKLVLLCHESEVKDDD